MIMKMKTIMIMKMIMNQSIITCQIAINIIAK